MEAAESSANSSKVIVQCHDPNNVFDRILPNLESRSPLTKLHWKSPTRPLRSIDQLNVSFIRGDLKSDATTNPRRHQIPGLRQTPAVKVYLARCDDRETYKETCRKDVKQWLKSQGISQDGKTLMKGQERHDAYEYIILHVVFPGTAAATQPRFSKHISVEASESTDSVNSKSKWPGKSSSTILDKLRADFSSSSKAPFERVAQVRFPDPENKLPIGLGPSEIEEQWQDFVDKLKTAILLSFDARVAQYEDDIRERESQRQLPGWNFCTFFILKEGLAKGFENVGLIEDALTIYDELDAGLDNIVQDQTSHTDPDPTSALLPFSNDLKPAIRLALDNKSDGKVEEVLDASKLNLQDFVSLERKDFPFDVERKNYQQRILTNQVSALDFHIYIFTRQLQLYSRQANLVSLLPRAEGTVSTNKHHCNLGVIADICEKATGFITFASRALRRDLYAAWGGQQGLDDNELETQHFIIGGLVASWKWSATMQILADCHIVHLLGDKLAVPESYLESVARQQSSKNEDVNRKLAPYTENLALWAGELIMLARDVLHNLMLSQQIRTVHHDAAKGLQSRSLNLLFTSNDSAAAAFKLFILHAYQCFNIAHRVSASHQLLHALADIELKSDRPEAAIQWLEHIPNLSNLEARTATDRTLLSLYAQCLKTQDRADDYASTLAALLLCSASSPVARSLPQYDDQVQHILNQLVAVSHKIHPIELPLTGLVTIKDVASTISLNDNGIGFYISLSLALKFQAELAVPEMEIQLNSTDGCDPPQIILRTTEIVNLSRTSSTAKLASNVTTEGQYELSRLELKIGNLMMAHDFGHVEADVEGTFSKKLSKPAPINLYAHRDTFSLQARPSSVIDLTKPARLLFQASTNLLPIEQCTIRLRPATAGVRLDIQSAISLAGSDSNKLRVMRQDDANVILLNNIEPGVPLSFEIPYSTEILSNSITIKIEATCLADSTTFSAFCKPSIVVNLPISVNVQDIFQVEKLFSRFTATPSTHIPIRVLEWKIDENDNYNVKYGTGSQTPVDVFPKMSASWVIEAATRRIGQDQQNGLPLRVRYQTYDEALLYEVKELLQKDLSGSPLGFATGLLSTHLLNHLPSVWTEQDLEAVALLHEFEMYSYETMNWERPLQALSSGDRKQAETWLKEWHIRHRTINLDLTRTRIREVKLSVEMPAPALVVSTSLRFAEAKQYLAQGEPILAQLIFQCVCTKDLRADIQFEITSSPEIWLIGGKKKGTLEAKTQKTIFEVVMIPQKPGHLLLPGIDVKGRQMDAQGNMHSIHIEVESKSQAKSVLVVPNLRSTTVAIGGEGSASRHWTVATRSRNDFS